MKAPAERGREGSGKRELVYVSQEVQHVVHYMIAVMHYQPAHSTFFLPFSLCFMDTILPLFVFVSLAPPAQAEICSTR